VILADSSIWIDHFRSPIGELVSVIRAGHLLVHRMLVGELALGWVPDRTSLLSSLQAMPKLAEVSDDALLTFIDRHKLISVGIGLVDVHFLASVQASPGSKLWTRDKRLLAQAQRLGLAHEPR
jgi:predicted nucleic acid-binding protein